MYLAAIGRICVHRALERAALRAEIPFVVDIQRRAMFPCKRCEIASRQIQMMPGAGRVILPKRHGVPSVLYRF